MKIRLKLLALFLLIGLLGKVWQIHAQPSSNPAIIILNVDPNYVHYARAGWTAPQPLRAGDVLNSGDYIYPNFPSAKVGIVLTVLCSDGTIATFSVNQLNANQPIPCVKSTQTLPIIGNAGLTSIKIQRGGRQDPLIPYLISPRATAMTTDKVELVWNHVGDVEHYTITVQAGADVIWESGALKPEQVVEGDTGRVVLPVSLKEQTIYTVEICVLFANLKSGCTTDPGWSTGSGLAFYYVPASSILPFAANFAQSLGTNSPEYLYAYSALLKESISSLSASEPIGYYSEAIDALEEVLSKYPTSELAKSPRLYYELGELYRNIQLPRTAAKYFTQALNLATSGPLSNIPNETAALAAIGLARTTPDASQTVTLYNQALAQFKFYMNETTYSSERQALCDVIGDLCTSINP
ncbi:MAG: hypothetical protein GC179_08790 [Anaerolineaceae bacterium]|nr:hypothetical protein [Anaerolineaceae bacterium]